MLFENSSVISAGKPFHQVSLIVAVTESSFEALRSKKEDWREEER